MICKEAFVKLRDANDEYYKKKSEKQNTNDGLKENSVAPATPSKVKDCITFFDSPTKEADLKSLRKSSAFED